MSCTSTRRILAAERSTSFPLPMSRPVVRVLFALLVVATIAAFFATQQLKSEVPLVIRFAAKPKQFSPNADGVRDRSAVGFDLSEPATVSFSIMDRRERVRRLVAIARRRRR